MLDHDLYEHACCVSSHYDWFQENGSDEEDEIGLAQSRSGGGSGKKVNRVLYPVHTSLF